MPYVWLRHCNVGVHQATNDEPSTILSQRAGGRASPCADRRRQRPDIELLPGRSRGHPSRELPALSANDSSHAGRPLSVYDAERPIYMVGGSWSAPVVGGTAAAWLMHGRDSTHLYVAVD